MKRFLSLILLVTLAVACGRKEAVESRLEPFQHKGFYRSLQAGNLVIDRVYWLRHYRDGGSTFREVGCWEAEDPYSGVVILEINRCTRDLSPYPAGLGRWRTDLSKWNRVTPEFPDARRWWVREVPYLFTERMDFFSEDSIRYELEWMEKPNCYWIGTWEATYCWMKLKVGHFYEADGTLRSEYDNFTFFQAWDIWDGKLYFSGFTQSKLQDAEFISKKWEPTMPVQSMPKTRIDKESEKNPIFLPRR